MEATDSLVQINFLADEIGELVYNWGFKRVHGRIWTHLFLSNRPLDASDLVKRLDISKALISISLRELLDLKLIAEIGKSTKGTHLYRTNPDLVRVFLNILKIREKLLFSKVNSALKNVENMSTENKQKSEISDVRILELKKLMAGADATIDQMIGIDSEQMAHWQALFTPVENEKILHQERAPKTVETTSGSTESMSVKPIKMATSEGVKASGAETSVEGYQLSPGVSLAKGSSTLF